LDSVFYSSSLSTNAFGQLQAKVVGVSDGDTFMHLKNMELTKKKFKKLILNF
jgi:hypothetical protein